jgi:hypothetical protein
MGFYPLTYLMYDYLSQPGVSRVTAAELEPGDHVFVVTPLNVGAHRVGHFTHHAIFVGPHDVRGVRTPAIVHLTPRVVVARPVERLSARYHLYRVAHDDVADKDAIVARCRDAAKPNRYAAFNVLTSNCEHFANFCVYGRSFSRQIRRPLKVAVAVLAVATLVALYRRCRTHRRRTHRARTAAERTTTRNFFFVRG